MDQLRKSLKLLRFLQVLSSSQEEPLPFGCFRLDVLMQKPPGSFWSRAQIIPFPLRSS